MAQYQQELAAVRLSLFWCLFFLKLIHHHKTRLRLSPYLMTKTKDCKSRELFVALPVTHVSNINFHDHTQHDVTLPLRGVVSYFMSRPMAGAMGRQSLPMNGTIPQSPTLLYPRLGELVPRRSLAVGYPRRL